MASAAKHATSNTQSEGNQNTDENRNKRISEHSHNNYFAIEPLGVQTPVM